jgi:hypothetical protein
MDQNKQDEIYSKYMAVHSVMLEDFKAMEIAAVLIVQGLSIYRTVLSEEDYQKMVDEIYGSKDDVYIFEDNGPIIK